MDSYISIDPSTYDWNTISNTNLLSCIDLHEIRDRFPDIRMHFPRKEVTCLGKLKFDWSHFHLQEFRNTIDAHTSILNSLEDLLIKNILWVKERPLEYSPYQEELDDQLTDLYKLTLLIRIGELYRDHIERKCMCGISRLKLVKYLSCFMWGVSFIAGSIDSIVQESSEDCAGPTFANTVLWFSSGGFSALALWIQKIDSKNQRVLDSISRIIAIRNDIKTWHDRITLSQQGFTGIQERITHEVMFETSERMPDWLISLTGILDLIEKNEELSPFAKVELESILYESIKENFHLLLDVKSKAFTQTIDRILIFYNQLSAKKTASTASAEVV